MTNFSPETIVEFIEEPSWTERAKLIERIATFYLDRKFDDAETRTALEIFRVTLYDGEPLVRRILAETLKHARDLPSDIVAALAHDVAEVATPFLAFSPQLTADDLAAIARDGTEAHRQAIARRACDSAGAQRTVSGPRRTAVARERPSLKLIEADAILDITPA